MWRIVLNNLRHERLRFTVAVVGVVFAITLIAIQAAILLGAIDSSSLLVRTCDADLWIVRERSLNADLAIPMSDRCMYQALGVPGVAQAGRLLVNFGLYRFPNGRQEGVVVVGVDPNHDWMGVARARDPRVLSDRYILLDKREESRFATAGRKVQVGDRVELNGHRAEVAGIVSGRSSFIATPYVFASYKGALDFTGHPGGNTTFVVIKCAPGADVAEVQRQLQSRLSEVEVLTRDQFATRCWHYWVLGTGLGMAMGLSAGLAFLVGCVIVSQTIFTSVLARIKEYAVLKAVGFGNGFVVSVVALQSLAVVLVGYPLAVAAAFGFQHFAGQGGTAVVLKLPPSLLAALVPVSFLMCAISGLGACAKALRVAPAKVFR